MEVINTHGPRGRTPPFFQPLYSDLYNNKKITPITRIEYEYGKTVPSPSTINSQTWANNHVVPLINTLKDSALVAARQRAEHHRRRRRLDEWPGHAAGYAQVYKDVRNAIQSSAQVGSPGAHKLMVAPVSPGGVIPGVRWMGGNDWLGQTIDAHPGDQHADRRHRPARLRRRRRGAAVFGRHHAADRGDRRQRPRQRADFSHRVEPLQRPEPAGCGRPRRTPRTSRDARSRNSTAGTARRAITTSSAPPGSSTTPAIATTPPAPPWAGYSIKYWKTAGNPYGTNGDLQTAFEQAVDQRYAAGFSGGTSPMPASVQMIDNFETGSPQRRATGHFDKSLNPSLGRCASASTRASSVATRDAGANYSSSGARSSRCYGPATAAGWQSSATLSGD